MKASMRSRRPRLPGISDRRRVDKHGQRSVTRVATRPTRLSLSDPAGHSAIDLSTFHTQFSLKHGCCGPSVSTLPAASSVSNVFVRLTTVQSHSICPPHSSRNHPPCTPRRRVFPHQILRQVLQTPILEHILCQATCAEAPRRAAREEEMERGRRCVRPLS